MAKVLKFGFTNPKQPSATKEVVEKYPFPAVVFERPSVGEHKTVTKISFNSHAKNYLGLTGAEVMTVIQSEEGPIIAFLKEAHPDIPKSAMKPLKTSSSGEIYLRDASIWNGFRGDIAENIQMVAELQKVEMDPDVMESFPGIIPVTLVNISLEKEEEEPKKEQAPEELPTIPAPATAMENAPTAPLNGVPQVTSEATNVANSEGENNNVAKEESNDLDGTAQNEPAGSIFNEEEPGEETADDWG